MARLLMRATRLAAAGLLLAGFSGCSQSAKVAVEPRSEDKKPAETSAAAFTVTQATEAHYTPGGSITVKTTMNYTGSERVTALALQTKLPPAWTYEGIGGPLKPAVDPPKGTTGELTLIWIQIPSFPATVEYTLKVADWSEGTCTLSGQAIYRTLGGELKSPVTDVSLTRAQ